MDKTEFRRLMVKRRNALSADVRHEKSLVIAEKLFEEPAYKLSDSVFCYLSFRSEAETEPIINRAFKDGKTVALPYMTKNKGEMVFVKITGFSELVKNKFGIYEPVPKSENIIVPIDKTIIIIPGTAFSRDNYRMGYGGGYYDRYLSKHSFLSAVGIGFSEQLCDKIPVDEYDVRLNKIITDLK